MNFPMNFSKSKAPAKSPILEARVAALPQPASVEPSPPVTADRREIQSPMRALVSTLGEHWRLILAVAVACAVLSGIGGWLLPKKYEASVLLLPVAHDSSSDRLGGLSAIASQLGVGGLAALTGLGNSGSFKAESVATLQSDALTEQYIQLNNLLPILYSKIWDPRRRTWKTDDPEKIPTLWKANDYFKRNIRQVSENPKTGLVTLSIRWKDPKLAARWANDLVKLTNDYLRSRSLAESERHISYLQEQLAKTTLVPLQQSLYTLMESEFKSEMLARGREEYALRVIDPATVPEKPVTLKALVIAIIGFAVGAFVASGFLFLRHSWNANA
jgi:uncharacterized protein involved in exopolysaccharide biosynthesis